LQDNTVICNFCVSKC